MNASARILSCALLFAVAASARAQQANAWVSAEWTPMTDENERLYRQAEDKFKAAVEADMKQRKEHGRVGHRGGEGEGGLATVGRGGMGDGGMAHGGVAISMGGGMGGHRGGMDHGGMSGRVGFGSGISPAPGVRPSLGRLLPRELDFAAPTTGGLVLQRTDTSVIFGRTDNDQMVYLPLAGETDMANGMRASIHDEDGRMRLSVVLPTGEQVQFLYHQSAERPDRVMSVGIDIDSRFPGGPIELERLYRRAEVKVGELKKAGS